MKDGIRRAAERNHYGDGIFKSFARENIQWAKAALEHFDHRSPSPAAIIFLGLGDSVLRRAVWQAHAERLDGAGHCVGSVHAAARAGSGDRASFDRLQLAIAD